MSALELIAAVYCAGAVAIYAQCFRRLLRDRDHEPELREVPTWQVALELAVYAASWPIMLAVTSPRRR